jgi:hypothetical protein
MDRRRSLQLLNELDRRIADSKERIARQRDTVSQLKRGGEDARLAERLLAAFINFEAQHLEQRDKVRLALMNAQP